jgi:hypothetical protein
MTLWRERGSGASHALSSDGFLGSVGAQGVQPTNKINKLVFPTGQNDSKSAPWQQTAIRDFSQPENRLDARWRPLGDAAANVVAANAVSVVTSLDGEWSDYICIGCGFNTLPGCPPRELAELILRRDGKIQVPFSDASEVYIVRDSVWKQAGMKPRGAACASIVWKKGSGDGSRRGTFPTTCSTPCRERPDCASAGDAHDETALAAGAA